MNSAYETEIAALRAENEQLREELRQITEAFCAPLPLLSHFALTVTESKLLAVLYHTHGFVTKRALHISISGLEASTQLKGIDVWIWKLRTKLKPYGIAIECKFGFGYRLLPEGRETIRAMVGSEIGQLMQKASRADLRKIV